MSTPILLARIGALVYISVAVGVFVGPAYFRKIVEDFLKSPGASYLGSIMALIIGCLMVAAYNVWTFEWTVLITILGWGGIIKGLLGLMFPETFIDMSKRFLKIKSFASLGVMSLILGLVLGYYGFIVS